MYCEIEGQNLLNKHIFLSIFLVASKDHDDRGNNDGRKKGNSTRRVSFKPSVLQSKILIKNRASELALRTRLEDDEDMDGLVTNLNVIRCTSMSQIVI